MARPIHKLTDLRVKRLTADGWYGDGGNLSLQVRGASKSWVFRYRQAGEERVLGLGPYPEVTLAQAREIAASYRSLKARGIDPKEHRSEEAKQRLADASRPTFRECAEQCIESKRAGWSNQKHVSQWRNTLRDYVYPVFGDLPVDQIDLPLVRKCLNPIWDTKTETASRVRGRIEAILAWAIVNGYREGPNPAVWKGGLDSVYPNRNKVSPPHHMARLPFDEIPEFMATLRADQRTGARALEFLILTAARPSMAREALWSEIDFNKRVWTIPRERMKTGQEHRVPLSDAALQILQQMQQARTNDYVFPGSKADRPISTMDPVLRSVKRHMKRDKERDITAHGFRSTFTDWASETTDHSHEVIEMALAHTIRNKSEAAYRRGDLLERRRALMKAWADYCYSRV